MRLTGYPTSCLTFAVTLVKTTRQQRETLPIAGFALDADKWSGTGSISAGTRAMIWSTPARSITASRRNQKRSCMTASGQSRRFGDVRATSALPLIADVRCEDQQVRKVPESEVAILIRSWSARGYQRRDTGRPSAFAMASWRPCF